MKVIEDLPKSKLNSGDLKMKVTSGRVQRPARSRENRIQTRILKKDLTGSFENKEVRIYYDDIFVMTLLWRRFTILKAIITLPSLRT